MLVWGSSSLNIKKQFLVSGNCNACGHQDFVLHAIQHYGHFWWIPFIPWGKSYFLTCLQCESSTMNNDPEKLALDSKKNDFKTPFLSYIGFPILLVLICLLCLGDAKQDDIQPDKNYIASTNFDGIKNYDFIVLHDDEQLGYLLARVMKTEGKVITVQFSKHLYKSKYKLDSLVHHGDAVFKDDFFHPDYYETTIEQVKKAGQALEVISRIDHPSLKIKMENQSSSLEKEKN
jgi:hypothetical protein